jgi:hypothetical protein
MYVMKCFLEGFWRVVVTLGYMDPTEDAQEMVESVIAGISQIEDRFHIKGLEHNVPYQATVVKGSNVHDAAQNGIVYFLGKKRYDSKEPSNIFHRLLVGAFSAITAVSRDGRQTLLVPDKALIEVGLRIRI